MPQTLGTLSSPCPFLASCNLRAYKTDPEVLVCLSLRVAEGQNCHRGACPCPLPPWGLQWGAGLACSPMRGVLLGCAGCCSAMSHCSMNSAAGSVSFRNTSVPSRLHWG